MSRVFELIVFFWFFIMFTMLENISSDMSLAGDGSLVSNTNFSVSVGFYGSKDSLSLSVSVK